jgi:hypothetical protein
MELYLWVMISRRSLLRGLLGGAIAPTLEHIPSLGAEFNDLNWIQIRPQKSWESARALIEESLGGLKPNMDSAFNRSESQKTSNGALVVPGPGRLTQSLQDLEVSTQRLSYSKDLMGSIGLDSKLRGVYTETISRGLQPISFSAFGLIYKPSIFMKLRVSLNSQSTWKSRLNTLNLIKKTISPFTIGNNDGITGLYFFSTSLLAQNGSSFHYNLINAKTKLTLNRAEKTLKLMQSFLQFANKDASKISQDQSLDRVLSGKSAMTLDWTAILRQVDLWQAQDLAFKSFNPISLLNPLGYECETFSYFFSKSTEVNAESYNSLNSNSFGNTQLRALSDNFPCVYFLNSKREQQWPGLASQMSNLRTSRILPVQTWALNIQDAAEEDRVKSIIYDFIANPTLSSVTKYARALIS